MKKKLNKYIRTNRKSKGFTLVEMLAVLAIMSILFVVFTPKVAGYIKEAKKTKALEEVRQVVLAIDTYNIKSNNTVSGDSKYGTIKERIGSSDFIDFTRIKSINLDMTYQKMKELLAGGDFALAEDGTIS
ncbi:type II secretion system GspH family protein [Clostridium sp. SHJSY1]|uniref:type II secretion system protein n=1 Tax=Clostridium sp. SHJSY1 TaxID=2942483 RepID=UPI0028751FF7|nr:type II secretion system protein [Clostridium sp. SHJSY1]MDS0526089.1 type II secretion system GspH family protein [Clostridium sp. SHJSY1]